MTMRDNLASSIREHMEIIGEDGRHVGTVDGVEGNMIKLTKNDPEAGGKHHFLPLDVVSSVDGSQVRLMIPGEQALLEQEDVELSEGEDEEEEEEDGEDEEEDEDDEDDEDDEEEDDEEEDEEEIDTTEDQPA